MKQLISPPVLERAAGIRSAFQTAKPFRYACIEDFLQPEWAETLLAEFPVFDPGKAMNEFGKVGRKAVRTDMREISDRYREFYDYISSQPFLDAMSAMTGIPDLRFDKQMYGGGTHENLEGQALDAHVDFNYDQERQLHRRINLLIYLNKEWDVSWGGAIQLHSDPRDWDHDEVKTFNCTFNRCVVFETNEHSWHGFERIKLPAEKRGLSRKCISIYLYTRDRPAEEIVPVHGTFYVQRPLPERYKPGLTLSPEHLDELRQLVAQRDDWVGFYQRLEADLGGENRGLRHYADSLATYNGIDWLFNRLPLKGSLIPPARKAAALWLRGKKLVTNRPVPPLQAGPLPPLDPGIVPGRTLDEADVRTLRSALMGRDRLIQRYQSLELSLRRDHDTVHARISALLHNLCLPLKGGLRQEPDSLRGAYAGGWVSSRLEVKLKGGASAPRLKVMGWVPPHYPQGMRIEALIDGRPAGSLQPTPGEPFILDVAAGEAPGGVFALELKTTSPVPLPQPENDRRDLAFVLQGMSRA
ncbi:MAG TPA: 2OG-Fe(II) oxygenase [Gammaproteobacteria bacterium]|nr:2OG-Fe(II) oxygenase [Gammaproteobacteria bacterium]